MFQYALNSRAHGKKKKKVIFVFRKGEREDPSNSWPVQLTSAPDKMMEYMMQNSINKEFKEDNITDSKQRRFLKKSTKGW